MEVIKQGRQKSRKDDLMELKRKQQVRRRQNQGLLCPEEYRNTTQMCGDGIRKAKTWPELNLVKETKKNKKSFYRYIGQKGRL